MITLEKSNKTILNKIVTCDKLRFIINNTTYEQLYKLFDEDSDFNVSGYNCMQFMLFLAFLGTGYAHNLYDRIQLNPEFMES